MDINAVEHLATATQPGKFRWRPVYSTLAVCALTFGAGSAQAGPQGGEIVAGQGNINRAGNDVTVISQQSHRLGINWNTFNVAANESVVFQQPGSSSIALNRILDHNPSQILGAIDANGQVFLINPSGIIFGESARVNLHSIVASSLDISTEDFMNGNYDLKALSDRAGGLVVNRGLIQAATGGSVTLVGGSVSNEGLIVADYGQVNLAAGKRATLDFDGDRLMLFEVSEALLENAAGDAAAVSNSGTIQADGGQVLLTGSAARDVFGSVVNNTGVIRAGRIENVGGVVRLVAGAGTVLNSGEIDVSGTQDGGRVELLGDRVGVFDGATISADGATGGGTVLIGGGYQGADPDVLNADRTFIGATTTISADATASGDGGTIIAWSDEATRVYGNLSARGGAQSGDGGLIETSSKEYLDVRRTPDVTAPNGDGGTWLIDPNNIAIVAATGCQNITGCPTPAGPNFDTSNDDAEVGVDLITDALAGGANVVITTGTAGTNLEDGDISWAAGVNLDYDGGDGGSLTLSAANNISVDGDISDAGTSTGGTAGTASDESIDVFLIAGGNVTVNGTIDLLDGTLNVGSVGTPIGGSFTLGATGSLFGAGLTVYADADMTLSGSVDLSGASGATAVDLNGGLADGGSTILLDFSAYTGVDTTTVAAGDGSDDFTIASSLAAALTGGGGDDSFMLDNAILTGTIDGEGGTNSLRADNQTNTWMLTAPAAGTVNRISGGFTNITNITGGVASDEITVSTAWGGSIDTNSGLDTVIFMPGASVAGTIDGGSGGDTIDWSGYGSIDLVLSGLGTVDGFTGSESTTVAAGFDSIDTLINSGSGDTFTGPDMLNTWDLNGADDFLLNAIQFNDYANVIGGALSDNFTVSAAFAGNVSGGAGIDTFVLTTGTIGGLLDGGTGSDTLTAANVANTWTLSSNDGGSVTGITGGFDGITNVVGGSMVDNVTVSGAWAGDVSTGGGADLIALTTGTIGGALDGGTGTDTLTAADVANTWTLNSNDGGSVTGITGGFDGITNVVGGSMVDDVTVSGAWAGDVSTAGGADLIALTTGTIGGALDGGTGTDTLTAANVANTWTLSSNDGGSVTGITGGFDGITNVVGGSMVDNVTVSGAWAGDVSTAGGADTIALTTGTIGGALDGGTGTDTLTAANVANTWTLSSNDGGSVTGIAGGFDGITNVVGGSMVDDVTVSGAWAGDVSTAGGADTIALTTGTIGGALDGGTGTDTLTAANVANTWTLSSNDGGSVTGITGGFDGITDIVGGSMVDDVTVSGPWAGAMALGAADDIVRLAGGTVGGLVNGEAGFDELIADNVSNVWALIGPAPTPAFGGRGTVTGLTDNFSGFRRLTGGSMDDTFNVTGVFIGAVNGGAGNDSILLMGGALTGVVNGGTGNDTLGASDVANVWSITGAQTGSVTGVNLSGGGDGFSNISNLVGGSDADNFAFAAGASVDGTVDGGGGLDIIDWTSYGSAIALILSGSGSTDGFAGSETTTILAGFDNIDTLLNPGLGDSFTGPDTVNTWALNGTDDFTLNGDSWTDFADVTGGSLADQFTVSAAWGGNVSGGAGNDSVVLTSGTVGGAINGDADNDTLTVANVVNSWTINGPGAGLVTGAGGGFSGIENAIGGTDNDAFAFQAGGVMESIDGGAGSDTLNWSAYGSAIGLTISGMGSTDGSAGSEVTTVPTGFDNIDLFVGSGLGDSFVAQDTNNTWDLNGVDDFILNGIQFNDFANVVGGALVDAFTVSAAWGGNVSGGDGNDTFTLTTGSVAGLIDGNNGTNTLTAANAANTWTLTGAAAGTVSGVGGGFDNITNVVGGSSADSVTVAAAWGGSVATGSGADAVIFSPGSSIAGAIDGGADADTIDWSTFGSAINFTLAGAGSTDGFAGSEAASTASGFDNFDTVLNTGLGDSFTGPATANTWILTGVDDFMLNGVAWTDFANVTGGSLVDNFTISGPWAGNVSGGDGADEFTLSSGTVGGSISGNAGADRLTADNVANTWNLTSAGGGTVTGVGVNFVSISEVVGGSVADEVTVSAGWNGTIATGDGDDQVIFAAGSSVAGAIDGGNGTDTLDWSSYGVAVSILLTADGTLDGVAGSEGISGANFDNIDSAIGAGLGDALTAADMNNNWDLNGAQSFALNGNLFDGFASVTGGSMVDAFIVSAGFAGNVGGGLGDDTFTLTTGTIGGALDGGAGSDALTAANVANTWDISGADSGSVTGISGGFSNIANLAGGSLDDTVVFTSGTITGDFDGGAGSNALTAGDSANTWVLAGAGAGTVTGIGGSFTGFADVTGGSSTDDFTLTGAFGGSIDGGAGTNTLTAANTINTWELSGATAGTVTGISAFANINNVTGGTDQDTFTVTGMWGGDVNGGDGDDAVNYSGTGDVAGTVAGDAGDDTVSFAALAAPRDVVLGDGTINTVENFVGNFGVLSGDIATDNTWLLDSIAGGSVTNAGGTVIFTDFASIVGGSLVDAITVAANNEFGGDVSGGAGDDTILFENGAGIAGAVDGGADTDTLDWSAYAGRTVTLQGAGSVDGQAGTEVDSIISGFDNIDAFITSGMNDSLIAADIANLWIINGVDAFTLNGDAYSGFANLTGGADTDDFTLSGGSLSGAIDGALGSNTVTGDNVATVWNITGAAAGATDAIAGGFSNISAVTGGSDVDTFNLASDFTGTLNGGAGGDAFNLQGGSTFGGLDGGAGSDTLTGNDVASTWLLTDAGAGTVNGQSFGSFETALGGSAVDTMTVSGAFGGTINGGGGDDLLTLSTGGSLLALLGGEGSDTLSGDMADDIFIVAAASSGTLNGTVFADVENLVGAAGNDQFMVGAGAGVGAATAMNITMSGGAGMDVLTVDYDGAASRTLSFDGGADADTVVVTGGGAGFAGTYDASSGSLDYAGAGNSQSIIASAVELVQDTVTADSLVVNATAGDDVLAFGTGTVAGINPLSIALAGGTPIDTANKTDVSINGGGGNDAVEITSDVVVAGELQLDAETVSNGGGSISAALLRLLNVNLAGVSLPLQTSIGTLQIIGGTGAVNIEETDDLVLAASDNSGSVRVIAGGAVTQSGALAIGGVSTFDASSITLADANNDFGAAVSLTTTGGATIVDQNSLTLGASNVAGNLVATAAGDLNGIGAVMVGGTTALSSTGGSIDMSNAGNSFTGELSVAAANSATINAGSALTLGAATVGSNFSGTSTGNIELRQLLAAGGNVNLSAGGALSASGAGAITGATLTAQSTGGVSLLGSNAFTGLNVTNNGGAVEINNTATSLSVSGIAQTGAGGVSLANTGGLVLAGPLTAGSGAVSLNATQGIMQRGSITTNGGKVDLVAGTGITMASNATTSTNGGAIGYCTASGDVSLALLDAATGNVLVKSKQGGLFSVNGLSATNIRGTNVTLDASGAIGSQSQSITVDAPAGNAGLITFLNTSASQVFVANQNNTRESNQTTATIVDFGAAAAIAAFQAGQSSSLQDVGFVDLALFSPDVSLINTVGAGVLMPCSQMDDEEARCQ